MTEIKFKRRLCATRFVNATLVDVTLADTSVRLWLIGETSHVVFDETHHGIQRPAYDRRACGLACLFAG